MPSWEEGIWTKIDVAESKSFRLPNKLNAVSELTEQNLRQRVEDDQVIVTVLEV